VDGLRRGGGSGDCGIVLSEANGLVSVDTVIAHVRVNEVKDAWNEEEVLHCLEVVVGGLKGFIIKSIVP